MQEVGQRRSSCRGRLDDEGNEREAESVDLLPNGLKGERLPADVVAWDHITGLGLVRSRQALNIAPMPLGTSAAIGAGDAVIAVDWHRSAGMLPGVVFDRADYAGYWEYMIEDALYVSPSHPGFPGAALVSLGGKLAGIGGFAATDPVDEYATDKGMRTRRNNSRALRRITAHRHDGRGNNAISSWTTRATCLLRCVRSIEGVRADRKNKGPNCS